MRSTLVCQTTPGSEVLIRRFTLIKTNAKWNDFCVASALGVELLCVASRLASPTETISWDIAFDIFVLSFPFVILRSWHSDTKQTHSVAIDDPPSATSDETTESKIQQRIALTVQQNAQRKIISTWAYLCRIFEKKKTRKCKTTNDERILSLSMFRITFIAIAFCSTWNDVMFNPKNVWQQRQSDEEERKVSLTVERKWWKLSTIWRRNGNVERRTPNLWINLFG